jgi:hypothetical protein
VINLLKKYWDILGGIITGLALSILAGFKLERIQLIYSIIILILVSIGTFKIIKQSIDKQKKKREKNIIDTMVDSQRSMKAIRMAQNPIKEGERVGTLILDIMKGMKNKMKQIKILFDKFKGYMLTFALAVLTIIEFCGGYLTEAFGDALVVNDIELIPLITLGAAVVVGCISNGFTKEQREKIRALFAKSTTDELVLKEIKKTIKEDEIKLKEFNKILCTQEAALENLRTEATSLRETYNAKKEMYKMIPQLATAEDVQLAANQVVAKESEVKAKEQEIARTNESINILQTKLNALRTQL